MPIDSQSKSVAGDSKIVKKSRQDPLSKFPPLYFIQNKLQNRLKVKYRNYPLTSCDKGQYITNVSVFRAI